jgi:hypothetical protein
MAQKNLVVLRPPKGKGRFANYENSSTISKRKRRKYKHAKYASNMAILGEIISGSDKWRSEGLNDVAYFLIDHVELIPKGALVVNGFDVHVIKVTGRHNCEGPSINVTMPCIKGLS